MLNAQAEARPPYSTLVSLAGIAIGTVAMFAALPVNTMPEGALKLPALALTLGVLAGPVYEVARGGIARVFRAEHLAILALIYFVLLDPLQGLYPVYLSEDTVAACFGITALFAAGCVAGAAAGPARLPAFLVDSATQRFSPNRLFLGLLLCFAVGMFNFAYRSDFSIEEMLAGLQARRGWALWNREALGSWNAFGDFLVYFGYVVPTLTIMIALEKRRFTSWMVGAGLACSVIFLAFVAQEGGRRIMGAIIASALMTWICAERARLRMRHILTLLVAVGATLLLLDMQLENRNRGMGNFSYDFDNSRGVRVDDNFLRMGQIIDAIPGTYQYSGFNWLLYVVVRPVPRAIWPEKPVDPGFSLADHLRQKGVTYSSSVVGEWYMGFGWAGVAVGGLCLGFAARTWSQLLEWPLPPSGVGLYGLGLMALIVGLRSLVEVVLMSYPLLCWLVVSRFFTVRARQTAGRVVLGA